MVMRRAFGILTFTVVTGLVAPIAATGTVADESRTTAAAPVAVERVSLPAITALRDEAAMVLLGTALIGLAAAVRRTT
jgi:hypothetical protein